MASFKMQPMGFTFVFVAFMSIQPMVVFVECMGVNLMNVHKPIESFFWLKNEIKSQSIKTLLPPNCTIFGLHYCFGRKSCCNGNCVDLLSDLLNCASCANVCLEPFLGSFFCCNGNCTNVWNDSNNCGGYGKECTNGDICILGLCKIPPSLPPPPPSPSPPPSTPPPPFPPSPPPPSPPPPPPPSPPPSPPPISD